MAEAVAAARDAEIDVGTSTVVHRPAPEGVVVERDGAAFVVLGRPAVRAVSVSDLTDPDALDHVHATLAKLGVDKALARAGAKEGDTVRIGQVEFEYEEDGLG